MIGNLVKSGEITTTTGTSMRFHNLDFMRFLAAANFVATHISWFFPNRLDPHVTLTRTHYLVHSISMLAFNGASAVMVFFVISGICIHAPYRQAKPLNVPEFYMRRYIRIGIPLLAALGITTGLTAVGYYAAEGVVWSLWCEMIYYLLYPLFLILIDKFGFWSVFAASVAGAMLFSLVPDQMRDHAWDYGPFLTWIVFLPVWLSGVWIAEHAAMVRRLPRFVQSNGFSAAGGIILVALSVLATFVQFHVRGGIQYPLYIELIFSAYAATFIFVFLSLDMTHNRTARFLERQGIWSYSLYLVHFPVLFVLAHALHSMGYDHLTPAITVPLSLMAFVASLFVATLFYRLVEKPSHWLAKHWGSKIAKLTPFATIRTSRREDRRCKSIIVKVRK
jgi:peptidoglycan/LPS O-acetylase OafA/YrhL